MKIQVLERTPTISITADPEPREEGWAFRIGFFPDDDPTWLLGGFSVDEKELPKGVKVGDVFPLL